LGNAIHLSRLKPAAFIAVLVFAFTSLAQGVTGSALTGKVTDPAGQAIPDAVVEARNEGTGATFVAVTDGSGEYLLDNLPPGGPY
jgi:hypothetical protein